MSIYTDRAKTAANAIRAKLHENPYAADWNGPFKPYLMVEAVATPDLSGLVKFRYAFPDPTVDHGGDPDAVRYDTEQVRLVPYEQAETLLDELMAVNTAWAEGRFEAGRIKLWRSPSERLRSLIDTHGSLPNIAGVSFDIDLQHIPVPPLPGDLPWETRHIEGVRNDLSYHLKGIDARLTKEVHWHFEQLLLWIGTRKLPPMPTVDELIARAHERMRLEREASR